MISGLLGALTEYYLLQARFHGAPPPGRVKVRAAPRPFLPAPTLQREEASARPPAPHARTRRPAYGAAPAAPPYDATDWWPPTGENPWEKRHCPRRVRVRSVEFYRAARVRPTSAAVLPLWDKRQRARTGHVSCTCRTTGMGQPGASTVVHPPVGGRTRDTPAQSGPRME
eukprot:gene17304-biopygen5329